MNGNNENFRNLRWNVNILQAGYRKLKLMISLPFKFLHYAKSRILKMEPQLAEYIEELLTIRGKISHMKNVASLRLVLDKTLELKAKEIGISKKELDDFLAMLRQ